MHSHTRTSRRFCRASSFKSTGTASGLVQMAARCRLDGALFGAGFYRDRKTYLAGYLAPALLNCLLGVESDYKRMPYPWGLRPKFVFCHNCISVMTTERPSVTGCKYLSFVLDVEPTRHHLEWAVCAAPNRNGAACLARHAAPNDVCETALGRPLECKPSCCRLQGANQVEIAGFQTSRANRR